MTSSQKGEGVQKCSKFVGYQHKFCRQRGGGCLYRSRNSVDVIFGFPLKGRTNGRTNERGETGESKLRCRSSGRSVCYVGQPNACNETGTLAVPSPITLPPLSLSLSLYLSLSPLRRRRLKIPIDFILNATVKAMGVGILMRDRKSRSSIALVCPLLSTLVIRPKGGAHAPRIQRAAGDVVRSSLVAIRNFAQLQRWRQLMGEIREEKKNCLSDCPDSSKSRDKIRTELREIAENRSNRMKILQLKIRGVES